MTQVKYTNQKWWVLLNPPKESDFYVNQGSEDGYFDSLSYEHALELSWLEIDQKDWERVRALLSENHLSVDSLLSSSDWQPTPDQIYSLPNEMEFEIIKEVREKRK